MGNRSCGKASELGGGGGVYTVSHELYHIVSGIHIVQLHFCIGNSRIVSNKSFIQEMILVKGPLETVSLPSALVSD